MAEPTTKPANGSDGLTAEERFLTSGQPDLTLDNIYDRLDSSTAYFFDASNPNMGKDMLEVRKSNKPAIDAILSDLQLDAKKTTAALTKEIVKDGKSDFPKVLGEKENVTAQEAANVQNTIIDAFENRINIAELHHGIDPMTGQGEALTTGIRVNVELNAQITADTILKTELIKAGMQASQKYVAEHPAPTPNTAPVVTKVAAPVVAAPEESRWQKMKDEAASAASAIKGKAGSAATSIKNETVALKNDIANSAVVAKLNTDTKVVENKVGAVKNVVVAHTEADAKALRDDVKAGVAKVEAKFGKPTPKEPSPTAPAQVPDARPQGQATTQPSK